MLQFPLLPPALHVLGGHIRDPLTQLAQNLFRGQRKVEPNPPQNLQLHGQVIDRWGIRFGEVLSQQRLRLTESALDRCLSSTITRLGPLLERPLRSLEQRTRTLSQTTVSIPDLSCS